MRENRRYKTLENNIHQRKPLISMFEIIPNKGIVLKWYSIATILPILAASVTLIISLRNLGIYHDNNTDLSGSWNSNIPSVQAKDRPNQASYMSASGEYNSIHQPTSISIDILDAFFHHSIVI